MFKLIVFLVIIFINCFYFVFFLFRCIVGMAEKVREAAARGETAKLERLLNDDNKPLPDEVSKLFLSHFMNMLNSHTILLMIVIL